MKSQHQRYHSLGDSGLVLMPFIVDCECGPLFAAVVDLQLCPKAYVFFEDGDPKKPEVCLYGESHTFTEEELIALLTTDACVGFMRRWLRHGGEYSRLTQMVASLHAHFNYDHIADLMDEFCIKFVGRRLQIPPCYEWTIEDLREIAIEVEERIAHYQKGKSRDMRRTRLSRPKYAGADTIYWLGPKALRRIEEFRMGNPLIKFRNRTLHIIALVCGYEGFHGYRRKIRWDE